MHNNYIYNVDAHPQFDYEIIPFLPFLYELFPL